MTDRAGVRRSVIRTAASALLAVVPGFVVVACARTLPPPGGERDSTPPAVLSITPEPMSTVAPTDEPVVIEFEERISEQGVEDAVYVSPVTGSIDASSGRRDIEVGIAGGWQPNRVYRVVVRPVIEDMFDNRLDRPIEIAFSTGAPFSDAAAAGVAYERVTGTKAESVRVEAHPVGAGAIDNLELAEATAIGEAVFTSLSAIQNFQSSLDAAEEEAAPARIVLLSDGTNTVGREDTQAIDAAREAGVPVSTIAFGTDYGTLDLDGETVPVPVDRAALERIADETGGSYSEAASAAELEEVYADLGSQIGYTTEPKDVSYWFVRAGVALALLGAVMSLLWTNRLV